MSEEQQLWQYIVGGQQLGPVTADQLQHLAASGDLTPETFLWTDGLEDWIPASKVEGLFASPAVQPHQPQLLTGASQGHAVQTAHPVQPVAQPAQPQVMPYVAPTVAGVAPLGGAAAPIGFMGTAQPGTDYPPTSIKRSGYGLFLWTFLGGIGCFIAAVIVLGALAGGANGEEANGAGDLGALVLFFGGFGLLLWHYIVSMIYLYRGWACLRYGGPATTPGKAVGLMFVPFFNFYWIFVAIAGFPKDWNRIMRSYPNLQQGPRMSEGTFMAYAICAIVFTPVAMILYFVIYADICKGINFMASRHLQPLGGLAQPSGGIRLY